MQGDIRRRIPERLTTPHTLESRATGRVMRRLMPYLFLCYLVNYIDRVNVGFAALQMNEALGFTPTIFGWGAGMFFLGYVVFEVPSNLIMERVGARIWIARIMITWGLITSCLSLIHTPGQFYAVRFLLGVSEAGFFPGMIWYLSYWIPAKDRARGAALFLTSTSLSGVIGGPLAAAILRMTGGGWAGWQWLFFLEGIPAVVLGLVTLRFLDDRVQDARWIPAAERRALAARIDREHRATQAKHGYSLRQALTHPRVLHLCLLYFSIIISFYGVAFWLPQITKSFSGLSNSLVAASAAGPFLCAAIAMVIAGTHSDRTGERRLHIAGAAATGAVGLALSAWLIGFSPWGAYLALCLGAAGIWSTLGPFWSLPSTFLTGTAAAGGIALVNSCGNIGGFVGPYGVGWAREALNSYPAGLLFLSATLVCAAGLALTLKPER